MTETTEERVRKIVVDFLDAPQPERITRDTGLVEDLDADSLDRVEMVMALEEEFLTTVPDNEIETLVTFGDLVDAMDRLRPADPVPLSFRADSIAISDCVVGGAMISCQVDDQTLETLRRVSQETGRTVADLAESAIAEAALVAAR